MGPRRRRHPRERQLRPERRPGAGHVEGGVAGARGHGRHGADARAAADSGGRGDARGEDRHGAAAERGASAEQQFGGGADLEMTFELRAAPGLHYLVELV